MRRRLFIATGLILVAAAFAFYLGSPPLDDVSRAADPALSALEDFRQTNGRYPESLGQLVPRPLAKLPSQWKVKEWRYTTSDSGRAYHLQACLSSGGGCYPSYYYSSKSRDWGADF
jgi:hypothetical protein